MPLTSSGGKRKAAISVKNGDNGGPPPSKLKVKEESLVDGGGDVENDSDGTDMPSPVQPEHQGWNS